MRSIIKFFVIIPIIIMKCYFLYGVAPSLQIMAMDARVMGLGGIFTGVSGDINSLYINPAGIYDINSKYVMGLSHIIWFEDVSFDSLKFGYSLFSKGIIGAGISYFSLPEFNMLGRWGENDGTKIGATEMLFTLSYANNLINFFKKEKFNLNYGISFKYLSSKLGLRSSSTIGIDMGFIYKINLPNPLTKKLFSNPLGIGISVQNLLASQKFINEKNKIPEKINLGVSYYLYQDKKLSFLLLFDAKIENIDYINDITSGCGTEISIMNMFFLRGSYNFVDSIERFNLGGGFKYTNGKIMKKIKEIEIDYSLMRFSEIGENTHFFSLNLKF